VSDSENPYKAPRSNLSRDDPDFEVEFGELPNFRQRAGARIIDTVAYYAVALFAGISAGIILVIMESSGATDPGWVDRFDESGTADFLIGTIASVSFHAICEGYSGASPGKLLLGLRVVNWDGGKVSWYGAFVRSFAFLVDSLFFGAVAYTSMKDSPTQQRYGDKWGNTRVVFAKDLPEASQAAGPVLLGAALSSAVVGLLMVATYVLQAI